ncbi:unnamed protein product [Phytophthora lilii]|uniref:Unnamed protein product n=1 Tax=Phytophthora lilii TaxID=2077276 RepID=A0A9W6X1I9_9STRA|nr:unnamed protein product [Phytophthora lilii]
MSESDARHREYDLSLLYKSTSQLILHPDTASYSAKIPPGANDQQVTNDSKLVKLPTTYIVASMQVAIRCSMP